MTIRFIAVSATPQTNKFLTKLSVGLPSGGFVADELSPRVNVGEDAESGTYLEWDNFYLNENQSDVRALRSDSNLVDNSKATERTYACVAHSLMSVIDAREFKDHRNKEIQFASRVTTGLLQLLQINHENRVGTLLTTAGNYGSDNKKTLTNLWDDAINGDPEGDIEVARAACLFEPNTIMIPIERWRKVRQHPAVRQLIMNTDARLLTEDMVPPTLFGLRLVVPGARSVTSLPGSTETLARIWGNFCWVGYVNPNPDPMKEEPTFSYTFTASGRKVLTSTKGNNEVIDSHFDISDSKITSAKTGYLITTITS